MDVHGWETGHPTVFDIYEAADEHGRRLSSGTRVPVTTARDQRHPPSPLERQEPPPRVSRPVSRQSGSHQLSSSHPRHSSCAYYTQNSCEPTIDKIRDKSSLVEEFIELANQVLCPNSHSFNMRLVKHRNTVTDGPFAIIGQHSH